MVPVCSHCRADAVGITIPERIRDHARTDSPYASVCRVCLTVDLLEDEPTGNESLTIISDAFPDDEETAAMVAVVVGLLDSLALYRRDIQAVVDELEAAGVDALLVLERLAEDQSLTPSLDLDRRVHQLEQLLE